MTTVHLLEATPFDPSASSTLSAIPAPFGDWVFGGNITFSFTTGGGELGREGVKLQAQMARDLAGLRDEIAGLRGDNARLTSNLSRVVAHFVERAA